MEPRFLAACSLIGLGAAIGITLMVARILVTPGLVIVLLAICGSFLIYAKHFRKVYIVLRKGTKYTGPSPIELLSVAGIMVLLLIILPVIYSKNIAEEIQLNRAELRLAGISPFKTTGATSGQVNVSMD